MDKKRIGIYTYLHNNYGSCLQAYAMSEILKSRGFTPVFFQRKQTRALSLRFAITALLRSPLDFAKKCLTKIGLIKASCNHRAHVSQFANQKFAEFKSIKLSILTTTLSQAKKLAKEKNYVAFIAGSDQVWGGEKTLWNGFEFLTFAPQRKKIAYAPSVGTRIAPYNFRRFRKQIPRFAYVSVREKQGALEIGEITQKNLPVVLDPTLLWEKSQWQSVAQVPEESEPYIATYFLDELSDLALEHIKTLQKKTGFKVINIAYPNRLSQNSGVLHVEPSPLEWVGILQNAEVVCTDSFHGVAFAINLQKEFFVYERQYQESSSQGSRIDSILKICCVEDRKVAALSQEFRNIVWETVEKNLQSERERSLKYLDHALRDIIGKESL